MEVGEQKREARDMSTEPDKGQVEKRNDADPLSCSQRHHMTSDCVDLRVSPQRILISNKKKKRF